jgi:iron uptake system component EfeO
MIRTSLVWFLVACSDPDPSPADVATLEVKAYIEAELDALALASADLADAAPAPDADGWNATDDAAAVEAMRAAWRRARVHYERIEGAIALLFSDLDTSTDARYDGFIEDSPDPNLFDGAGVTGVHGIERILFADAHAPEVLAFESVLPNYVAARFPMNEIEARDFREGLLQRLVDDVEAMRAGFEPLALDPAAAYRGVVGSMEEQLEKVNLAATGEDESRYARHTLADMRANLEGGVAVYGVFSEWIVAEGGAEEDAAIRAGFDRLEAQYALTPGDAIPEVPADWNPVSPDPAHLATPYGMLFELLSFESDPVAPDSLVTRMNLAGDRIGIRRVR